MITFIEHRECEVSHVALWDEFLTLILDEKSRKLIMREGIEYVLSELRKGPEGRYGIAQGGLFIRD